MMELNIYKKGVLVKTYKTDTYDISMGTVEDMLQYIDDSVGLENVPVDEQPQAMIAIFMKNIGIIRSFLTDVFSDITEDEIRCVKMKDIMSIMASLVMYVKKSLGGNTIKN